MIRLTNIVSENLLPMKTIPVQSLAYVLRLMIEESLKRKRKPLRNIIGYGFEGDYIHETEFVKTMLKYIFSDMKSRKCMEFDALSSADDNFAIAAAKRILEALHLTDWEMPTLMVYIKEQSPT